MPSLEAERNPSTTTYPRKRWTVEPPHPGAPALAKELGLSPVVAQMLLNRGLADGGAARDFLKPTLKILHDPMLLPGLPEASKRLAAAIAKNEKIVIYGDYDVDGITATAILWHALRLLGGHAETYVPHRLEEGYGLNAEAVAQLCDDGAKVIVTVDCGITAIEPAAVAKGRGVDLIVTDHHEWAVDSGRWAVGEEADSAPSSLPTAHRPPPTAHRPLLPACAAVVHPRLPADPPYPNPNLCGAGVAFKLAWGVGLAVSGTDRVPDALRGFLVEATALAALGTIADVVPLVGENRAIAHFGLGGLTASKLTGLRALIRSAGLDGKDLDSYHVGFLLAPRLNAAGRMGHAREAVTLLTEASADEAGIIADELEQQNRSRQATERKILDQAMEQVEADLAENPGDAAIVLGGEGWHPGVIGIVAGRLVDRFHRPAIVVGFENGRGQGSARSIEGFALSDALAACGEHLLTHGGHAMAAGLSLREADFQTFRAAFGAVAKERLAAVDLTPRLSLDATCDLADVTEALIDQIARLGPFGNANRRPLLCLRNLELTADPRAVGKRGDVLQLWLRSGRSRLKGVVFNCPTPPANLRSGATIDAAVEAKINEWQGRRSVELEVRDFEVKG